MLVRRKSMAGLRDETLLEPECRIGEGRSLVVSPFDSSDTLPDISPDQPTGPSLEFDADFAELERLAQGKPEQQFGATIVPAEEPDWKAIIAGATALAARSHDLRVMAHLGVARLNRDGMIGYAETLATVRRMLRQRWADLHPQLDPEDDNDPMTRANSLLLLSQPARVLRVLRSMPLAKSPRVGTVSWRDIAIANGTLTAPDDVTKMTDAVIGGVFRDSEPGKLQAMRDAIASAADSAKDIPAAFDDFAGHGTGPDYTELNRLLRDIGQMIDRYAPAEASASTDSALDAEASDREDTTAVVASIPSGEERAKPIMNIQTMEPPTNRADALRLLDLVVEFYQRSEPSSPLPLLISRARRLAEMDFMEILRDLAPDGVTQAERIAGVSSSD